MIRCHDARHRGQRHARERRCDFAHHGPSAERTHQTASLAHVDVSIFAVAGEKAGDRWANVAGMRARHASRDRAGSPRRDRNQPRRLWSRVATDRARTPYSYLTASSLAAAVPVTPCDQRFGLDLADRSRWAGSESVFLRAWGKRHAGSNRPRSGKVPGNGIGRPGVMSTARPRASRRVSKRRRFGPGGAVAGDPLATAVDPDSRARLSCRS